MMQRIVETKKFMILRTNLTPLTSLWFQTLTQYKKNMIRIK